MDSAAWYAIWIVAGLHIGFGVAELFLWKRLTPLLKIYDADRAKITAPVGMNMGVYNGIIAACLLWLLHASGLGVDNIRSLGTLLLVSIIIAGIFGGFTIKWSIPIFQSLPAAIALVLLWRTTV